MKNLKRKIIFILSLAFGLNFISNIDLYSVKRKREYNPKEEPSSKKRKLNFNFDFSDILINNILPCMASLTNIKDLAKSILQFAKLNKNNLYKINPKLQLLKKLYNTVKNSNIQNKISILSNTSPLFLLCIPEIKQQINDDKEFKQIFFDIFNINKKGFLRTRNPFTNQTLLHFLVEHSYEQVYKEILNSTFIYLNTKDLIQRDGYNNNILHLTIMSGNNYILNKIITELKNNKKLKQLINQKNRSGFTPLGLAQNKTNQETIKILKNNGAIETFQNISQIDTDLINAARSGDLEQVEKLLKHPNINVNAQNNYGKTALIWASFKNYKEIVKELLQHPNINVNAQKNYGYTALICASDCGHIEIVKELLKHPNINVNAQDNNDNTALIWASYFGYKEIVKELLQHPNINVNAQDNNDNTALIWASYFGYTEIVKELLQHPNINVNAQNNNDDTALEIAKKNMLM
ncbi:ankyrin repeat domain-containing protein [Candidatus Babeliales bacterium]|nr:ankyrin repeat domain-containing protein [Candidatus Babeliales bacterium]